MIERAGRLWERRDKIEATGIFVGLLAVTVYCVMLIIQNEGIESMALAVLFGAVYLGAAGFMAVLYMRRNDRD